MKGIKTLLVIVLLFSSVNIFAAEKMWFNDLSCKDYLSENDCKDLSGLYKEDSNISKYNFATLDNQLKKITMLFNKGRDEIALKKFENFILSTKDILKKEDYENLLKNKDKILSLLVKYSKSEDYIKNPKHKFK